MTSATQLHSTPSAGPPPVATAFRSGRTGGPCAATGHPGLDELLGGGFPRGHLSELVGPRGPVLTDVMTTVLTAATARAELVALVDAGDQFAPAAAAASGLDLSRLLWVRGQASARSRNPLPAMLQALAALELIVDAGGFGVAMLDFSALSARQLTQLPATTWTRLCRRLATGNTCALLLGPEPRARSAEGQVLVLGPLSGGPGDGPDEGAGWEARVVQAHRLSDAFVVCPGHRADAHGGFRS